MKFDEYFRRFQAADFASEADARSAAQALTNPSAADMNKLLAVLTHPRALERVDAHKRRCFAFHMVAQRVRLRELFAPYVKALGMSDPLLIRSSTSANTSR